jgi:hypothetical protein
MSEHEARSRAFYDHDNDEPRPAGRRRRQVADWGVGEELFDGMPGRRFERRPHRDIPRGDAADGRRTIVIETGDDEPVAEIPPRGEKEFTTRDEALRARERHDELWAGDEPFGAAEDRWAAADAWAAGAEAWAAGADAAAAQDEVVPEDEPARRDDVIVRGGQEGRRTVKIGGRPGEFHGTAARARRRPPRTVHERVGARPERIAAWAFALGLILILIAVATAHATTF